MAEMQAQLAYQTSVGRWDPPVSLEIRNVDYRWSTDGLVWSSGGRTDPGIEPEGRVTRDAAMEQGLFAEVILNGILVNHGARPMLLTFRDTDPRNWRFPLQNQRVVLIDGEDRDQATIDPSESLRFTWVDRRSFEAWREHHVAHEERNMWDDEELEPPRPTFFESFRMMCSRRYRPYLEWKREIHERSGFRIVVDSRTVERVSTVWSVQLGQSPLETAGRDEASQKLLWQIRSPASSPIDDDVVMYRCGQDATLAQLEEPLFRTVPGRF
ncbi:hypothetical protein [Brachybacterium sp. FME24]|uniref:hypothetical protein n=1 Tax=Brachybacterium sp. FME24 TaxID=2742605 RepID=UPI001865E1FC|nr:hypothetical protein [Brachybacterium sp. FME24]